MTESKTKFQQTLIIFLAATVGFLTALLLGDHSELLHILINLDMGDLIIKGVMISFGALMITVFLGIIVAIIYLFLEDINKKKPITPSEKTDSFKSEKDCSDQSEPCKSCE